MFRMAGIDTDHALRLANERLDESRAAARAERTASAPHRAPSAPVRRVVAGIRGALRAVDVDRPAPRLTDYPFRA